MPFSAFFATCLTMVLATKRRKMSPTTISLTPPPGLARPSTIPIGCRRPLQECHQQPTSKRPARTIPNQLTFKDREQMVGGHPRRSRSCPSSRLCRFRTDLFTQLLSGDWWSSITVRSIPESGQLPGNFWAALLKISGFYPPDFFVNFPSWDGKRSPKVFLENFASSTARTTTTAGVT